MCTYMYLVVLRLGKWQRVVPLSHRMHLCLWTRASPTVSLRRQVTGTANTIETYYLFNIEHAEAL